VGSYPAPRGGGDRRAGPLLLDAARGAGGPSAARGARGDGRGHGDTLEPAGPGTRPLQQVGTTLHTVKSKNTLCYRDGFFASLLAYILTVYISVFDPVPVWIRIKLGPWIHIRIHNPVPDPGRPWPQKKERKKIDVLSWLCSLEGWRFVL